MTGPLPKDPALRQRRNKGTSKATLRASGEPLWKRGPALPKREAGWCAMTVAWWRDVWRSPMAKEYLRADVHGLFRVAILMERFWEQPSESLDARICAQEERYGLSPLARRRLEWKAERAQEGTAKRPVHRGDGLDPREMLRSVK